MRRFSTRAIDDPLTPTQGMVTAEVAGAARLVGDEPGGDPLWLSHGRLSYGLTDRLALSTAGALSWSVLEQQPLDERNPDPVSLSLTGGLFGAGYSSTSGWLFLPGVAVTLKRRLGERWWVDANVSGHALAEPGKSEVWSDWKLAAAAGVGRQLGERWALHGSAEAHRFVDVRGSTETNVERSGRSLAGALRLEFRPVWNVALTVGLRAGRVKDAWFGSGTAITPVLPPAGHEGFLHGELRLVLRF